MSDVRRGLGQKARSRARMGAASVSSVGGKDDPRWDRQRRARSTDFHLGAGIGVDRNGRDTVLVSEIDGNLIGFDERGALIVRMPPATPSPAPAAIVAQDPSDQTETNAALATLVDAVNRIQDILRAQEITS